MRIASALPLALPLGLLLLAAPASAQLSPPAWTRGATCYEVFVRSFFDSDGDGVGDLNGLTAKLDYINDGKPHSATSLGAKCIWLMPIAESPSYHGYDVTDYYRVERDYGTNADFRRFIAAAHKRGIKVVIDMVLNHESVWHPQFQAAIQDTASPYRKWFRFEKVKPTELNPWGNSNWHKSPAGDEYYYGFFGPHMPDLNYTYRPVVEEAKKVAKFWLQEMHVDGFRLDAISYLVEENGQIAHTPTTHAVLREYQAYLRQLNRDVFTVGEVTGTVSDLKGYYPDQLDSFFGFEVADSIISAVNTGSATALFPPLLSALANLPRDRWTPFIGNHDQPRPFTKLKQDAARTRVATIINMTMPGMPFVYYGDELGMIGDKPDERIRTPMQWTGARGAGFSTAMPWARLQSDSATSTVAAEMNDPQSLWTLHHALIALRTSNPALGRGTLTLASANDQAVLAYVRRDAGRAVLVVANLGAAPMNNVSISAAAGALPAGTWVMKSLLGGSNGSALTVAQDGSFKGYVPTASLAAKSAWVFELVSGGAKQH
ncbi:MAG: alpha amylase catalytic region [Gemmatimonadetes bacterium]|nr:alpha amylase catalytic region [Gemmatimonadota bacterium]